MFIQLKNHIAAIALLSGLICLMSSVSFAQCPTNNPSDASNITKQATETASKTKTLQNTLVEDGKQRDAVNGNANCSASPSNTQGKNEIKTTAYDYLKEKILKGSKSNIIKPQKNYDSAVKEIKKTFFAEGEGSDSMLGSVAGGVVGSVAGSAGTLFASTNNVNEVLQKRFDYVNEVAASSLSHSIALRKTVQEDIKSVTQAQTSGCNQLQGYQLQNRNLQALIKATAADIIVQILIMEANASQNLLKEPANLIELKEDGKSASISSESKSTLLSNIIETGKYAYVDIGVAKGNLNRQDIQHINNKGGIR